MRPSDIDDPVDDLWPGARLPEGGAIPKLYTRGARMGAPENVVPFRAKDKSLAPEIAASWGGRPPSNPARPTLPLLDGKKAMPNAKQITIRDFRAVQKNTLKGFITVDIPYGPFILTIVDVSIHRKGDRAWCGLPAAPQLTSEGQVRKDETGKIQYKNIISWSSREASDRFSAKVIELVEAAHPGATA